MADKSITRYYRASTPETRAAWSTYRSECQAIKEAAEAFAARFDGARPVYSGFGSGKHFYGLTFDPPMPPDIWTIPKAESGSTQRPRSRIVSKASIGKAERMAELRRVQAIFRDHEPKRRARLDPVFTALGTHWGNLFLLGYQLAERDGALYVATPLDLGEPCVEITGGEFYTATKGGV